MTVIGVRICNGCPILMIYRSHGDRSRVEGPFFWQRHIGVIVCVSPRPTLLVHKE
jgi:hypothetical protein